MMHEIWIGDYSVLIWVPKGSSATETKTIIRNTFAVSLASYGLAVVDAKDIK